MLYTIGYSNRTYSDFVLQIQSRNIVELVDVRSYPRSRNPAFTGKRIEQWAEELGLAYRQEGPVLGGLTEASPDSPAYDLAIRRLFISSIHTNIAIFCAEGEPENCHRCYNVGAALLLRQGVNGINIRRDDSDEGMVTSLRRVPRKRFNTLIVAPDVRW